MYPRLKLSASGCDDRELLPAPHRRGMGLDRTTPVDRPLRESVQHLVDGHPSLEPGQCRAEAEVDAVAEAEVVGDLAADVKALGVFELAVFAVGRTVEEHHHAPLRHHLAVVLDVTTDRAGLHGRGCFEPQDLLYRLGKQ